MNSLFDFNPSECRIKVMLAFGYTPKILQNRFDTRPYTGLLYVVQGRYIYSSNGKSFVGEAGSLIYLPPLSSPYSYRIQSSDGVEPETMQIELDLADKDGNPIAYSDCPCLLSEDAESLRQDIASVISLFVDKASTPLRLHGAVLNLLASCAELVDVKDERSLQKRLAPAFDYLQENYNKSVSVEVLARLCHLSESQLRRLFRRQTGKSPIAYKNELLLNSAKRLLKYGDLGIGEISDSLGFYDIYAFSHFFSASVGISPSEYRRSRRESGAGEEKA